MTDAPTTDQPVERNGSGSDEPDEPMVAQAVIVEPVNARGAGRPGHYPSRDTLDRELRTIKDEVLRMGSLVAAQIGSALEALVGHDADKATATIVGDARINEAQRHISSLITTTFGAPGASSAGRKARPSAGRTPNTEKKFAVTIPAALLIGCSAPINTPFVWNPPMSASVRVLARRST